jgi:hypothetical protein
MSLLPGYHKIEGFVHTSKGQLVENSVVVSSSVSTRVRLGWGFWILRLFNVTAPSRFEVHRQFLGGRNHEGGECQPGGLFLPTIVRLGYCCTSLRCRRPMALEILGQLQSLGSIAFKKPARTGGKHCPLALPVTAILRISRYRLSPATD